jgi:hypothetical protein
MDVKLGRSLGYIASVLVKTTELSDHEIRLRAMEQIMNSIKSGGKTAQGRSGFSEYWRIGEFQPWASENEEAGLLYHLAFEVNGAVITAAQGWRVLMSWASLLGIFMLAESPQSMPFELGTAGDFLELWREKLCTILADVVALERAVDLISEGYFDGHDVLFADSQKKLTSSHETARFLIVGYNCFAEENGKEPIDTEAIERSPGRKVHHFLNEWVMLSRSKVLVARGEIFAARDEVLALLKTDDPGTDR